MIVVPNVKELLGKKLIFGSFLRIKCQQINLTGV